MSPRFRPGIVALVLAPLTLAAQEARGPLASVRLLGSPVITIEVPATDSGAFAAAATALSQSDVRFGAEGPALDPAVPQFDFAQPAGEVRTLTGLLVGDALDAIARANARLRWAEADGMIVARMSNAGSFLDRRVGRYAVTDATPRMALEALVRLLAPDRATADGVTGVEGTAPAYEATLPARQGRNVTVTLDNATVVEILNALSRENGALSWIVRYERAPASIDTAIVTLRESGRIAIAGPPRPAPSPAPANAVVPNAPTANLYRLSTGGDVVNMVTSYARAAGVPVGIERLAMQPGSTPRRSSETIDITGVPPATAVGWIVAYDSRYEWTERSGRFVVRPKADPATPSVLDAPLARFVRDSAPFDAVVTDLLNLLSAESRPPTLSVTGANVPAGTLETAQRTPISVSLPGATTAREALDEICRSMGPVSWNVQEQINTSPDRRSYRLEIESPSGWRYVRPFTVLAPAPPAAPRAAIPDALDRDISRVSVPSAPGAPSPFLAIAAMARVPIGIEFAVSTVPSADPRMTVRATPAPQLGPGRLSEALAVLLDRSPGTELTVAGGVINIAPRGSAARPDHFLNRPIGSFSVAGVPASRALAFLRMRMNPANRAATIGDVPAEASPIRLPYLDRPVSLDLPDATPREVLNAIVNQNGALGWTVRYQRSDGGPGVEREEDCVLELWPMIGLASRSLAVSRDGVWGETPAAMRISMSSSVPGATAGPRAATINLPVNARTMASELSRWCQAMSLRCTMETAGAPLQTLPMRSEPPTGTYDFTGMSPREALDRLMTFVPELEWREQNGIYRLRSRSLPATGLALDRVIAAVDRRTETLNDVLTLIRSFITGDRSALPSISIGGGLVSGSAAQRERDRPVDLKMSNATTRQILDEIVRQYGPDCAWSVRYTEANGVYPELVLTISVGTGSIGVTMPIR